MSLRAVIRCLQYFAINQTRNQFVLRTSFRYLKDQHWNKGLKSLDGKEEKDFSKIRVILKDQNGNIMGNKSLIEAKFLAQKLGLHLIEDRDETKHFKYKEFKLVSNQYLAKMDKDSDEQQDANKNSETHGGDKDNVSSSAQTVKEVKHLVFSTKLNENDLLTKIRQLKRWLSKGHQIAVNVNNPKNDRKTLDQIYSKFETELKGFAKINQKKIKSNNTLKFMIVSDIDIKEQLKDTSGDHKSGDIDMENIDPNKLLSDEFEHELEKK